jgi:hypothetical protein
MYSTSTVRRLSVGLHRRAGLPYNSSASPKTKPKALPMASCCVHDRPAETHRHRHSTSMYKLYRHTFFTNTGSDFTCACSFTSAPSASVVLAANDIGDCKTMTVWVSEQVNRTYCTISFRVIAHCIRIKFWVTRTTFVVSFPRERPCVIFGSKSPPLLAVGDVPSPEACFQACRQYNVATYRPDGPEGFDCTSLTGGSIAETIVVCGPTTDYLFEHTAGSEVSPPNPSGWAKRAAEKGRSHRQGRDHVVLEHERGGFIERIVVAERIPRTPLYRTCAPLHERRGVHGRHNARVGYSTYSTRVHVTYSYLAYMQV